MVPVSTIIRLIGMGHTDRKRVEIQPLYLIPFATFFGNYLHGLYFPDMRDLNDAKIRLHRVDILAFHAKDGSE